MDDDGQQQQQQQNFDPATDRLIRKINASSDPKEDLHGNLVSELPEAENVDADVLTFAAAAPPPPVTAPRDRDRTLEKMEREVTKASNDQLPSKSKYTGSLAAVSTMSTRPGAVSVQGPDSVDPLYRHSNYTPTNSLTCSAAAHPIHSAGEEVLVEAELVNAAMDEEDDMVVVEAHKDSFCRMLRNDKRTQVICCVSVLLLVGLAVGVGVSLSSRNSSSSMENVKYVQTGQSLDGPAPNFALGPGLYGQFGKVVKSARDGTRVAISAPDYSSADGMEKRGLVQMFEERSTEGVSDDGTQSKEWTPLDLNIVGEAEDDRAGFSIDVATRDGGTIIVGSPGHSPSPDLPSAGQVKIYGELKGGSWIQLGRTLFGAIADAQLGSSVAMSEDGLRIAVVASGGAEGSTGRAQVLLYEFDLDLRDWVAIGNLIGGLGGSPLAMSADGNTVVLGDLSTAENDLVAKIQAYKYNEESKDWTKKGSMDLISAEGSYDTLWSPAVSADGQTIAVGSSVENADPFNFDEEYDLKVLAFRYDEDEWIQLGETLHDKTGSHLIAYRVSLSSDGKFLVIGDPGGFKFGARSGHAHVLHLSSDYEWIHIDKELEGMESGDEFGYSVSLSSDGTKVVVGAPKSRASGTEVGRVTVFKMKQLMR